MTDIVKALWGCSRPLPGREPWFTLLLAESRPRQLKAPGWRTPFPEEHLHPVGVEGEWGILPWGSGPYRHLLAIYAAIRHTHTSREYSQINRTAPQAVHRCILFISKTKPACVLRCFSVPVQHTGEYRESCEAHSSFGQKHHTTEFHGSFSHAAQESSEATLALWFIGREREKRYPLLSGLSKLPMCAPWSSRVLSGSDQHVTPSTPHLMLCFS